MKLAYYVCAETGVMDLPCSDHFWQFRPVSVLRAYLGRIVFRPRCDECRQPLDSGAQAYVSVLLLDGIEFSFQVCCPDCMNAKVEAWDAIKGMERIELCHNLPF